MPQPSTSNPFCNILSTYEFLMLMKYPGTAFEGQAGKFNSQQLDTKNSRRTKVGERQNLCPIVPKLKIDYMCQFYQAERKWSNPSPSWHQWHHQCPWMPHSLVLSAPTLRGKAVSPWGKLYRKPIRSNQTSNGFFMSYPHVQLDRPTST